VDGRTGALRKEMSHGLNGMVRGVAFAEESLSTDFAGVNGTEGTTVVVGLDTIDSAVAGATVVAAGVVTVVLDAVAGEDEGCCALGFPGEAGGFSTVFPAGAGCEFDEGFGVAAAAATGFSELCFGFKGVAGGARDGLDFSFACPESTGLALSPFDAAVGFASFLTVSGCSEAWFFAAAVWDSLLSLASDILWLADDAAAGLGTSCDLGAGLTC